MLDAGLGRRSPLLVSGLLAVLVLLTAVLVSQVSLASWKGDSGVGSSMSTGTFGVIGSEDTDNAVIYDNDPIPLNDGVRSSTSARGTDEVTEGSCVFYRFLVRSDDDTDVFGEMMLEDFDVDMSSSAGVDWSWYLVAGS